MTERDATPPVPAQPKSPAELVRELRVKYGSHDALAAELGTRRQTVINWEHGQIPRVHYAKKLAALSGLEPAAYMKPAPADDASDIRDQLGRIEQAVTNGPTAEVGEQAALMLKTVAQQLHAQTQMLAQLKTTSATLSKVAESLTEASSSLSQVATRLEKQAPPVAQKPA